jgi:hypothetical protein
MDTAVLSAENKLQTVESEVCVHSKNLWHAPAFSHSPTDPNHETRHNVRRTANSNVMTAMTFNLTVSWFIYTVTSTDRFEPSGVQCGMAAEVQQVNYSEPDVTWYDRLQTSLHIAKEQKNGKSFILYRTFKKFVHLMITVQKTRKNKTVSITYHDNVVRIRDNRWRSCESNVSMAVSINVRRLAGDTLNITCNLLHWCTKIFWSLVM